eukprot:g66878.t1
MATFFESQTSPEKGDPASQESTELELALFKALSDDTHPPREKYQKTILRESFRKTLMVELFEQIKPDKKWTVLFKALLLMESLLNEGHVSALRHSVAEWPWDILNSYEDASYPEGARLVRLLFAYISAKVQTMKKVGRFQHFKTPTHKDTAWPPLFSLRALIRAYSYELHQMDVLLKFPTKVSAKEKHFVDCLLAYLQRDAVRLYRVIRAITFNFLDRETELKECSASKLTTLFTLVEFFRRLEAQFDDWFKGVKEVNQLEVGKPNTRTVPVALEELLRKCIADAPTLDDSSRGKEASKQTEPAAPAATEQQQQQQPPPNMTDDAQEEAEILAEQAEVAKEQAHQSEDNQAEQDAAAAALAAAAARHEEEESAKAAAQAAAALAARQEEEKIAAERAANAKREQEERAKEAEAAAKKAEGEKAEEAAKAAQVAAEAALAAAEAANKEEQERLAAEAARKQEETKAEAAAKAAAQAQAKKEAEEKAAAAAAAAAQKKAQDERAAALAAKKQEQEREAAAAAAKAEAAAKEEEEKTRAEVAAAALKRAKEEAAERRQSLAKAQKAKAAEDKAKVQEERKRKAQQFTAQGLCDHGNQPKQCFLCKKSQLTAVASPRNKTGLCEHGQVATLCLLCIKEVHSGTLSF